MFTYEQLFQQQTSIVARLRQEVEGLLQVEDVRASTRGDAVMFVGRLRHDAETVYTALRERFRLLGYTPILRREGRADVLVAQRGLAGTVRHKPWVNLALFVATLFTTLFAGAAFARVDPVRALEVALRSGAWQPLAEALLAGAPFALTLLFILGVHEMGHYLAARRHGAQVTLPYFIPMPFGLLGTFGAFIQLKSPMESRKALFDIGLAGPLAGLVVAVPLLVLGLLQSEVVAAPTAGRLGQSLLTGWMVDWLQPHGAGQAVMLDPVAVAAWFGLLVTGFNLLPLGQLDGGHVAYAVLGQAARPLAAVTFGGLLFLGWTTWSGWWTWAFLALLTGLGHPAPLNDITPLDGWRRFLGLLTLALFVLIITPRPF